MLLKTLPSVKKLLIFKNISSCFITKNGFSASSELSTTMIFWAKISKIRNKLSRIAIDLDSGLKSFLIQSEMLQPSLQKLVVNSMKKNFKFWIDRRFGNGGNFSFSDYINQRPIYWCVYFFENLVFQSMKMINFVADRRS